MVDPLWMLASPVTPHMADWLLGLRRKAGHWPEAVEVVRREIAIRGESAKRLRGLAELHLENGEAQNAYFTAKRAKELARDDAEAAAAQGLIERATDGGATISVAKAPPWLRQ